jgi:hypothetical protein
MTGLLHQNPNQHVPERDMIIHYHDALFHPVLPSFGAARTVRCGGLPVDAQPIERRS